MRHLGSSLFTFFFTHLSQLPQISFTRPEATYTPYPWFVFFLNSQFLPWLLSTPTLAPYRCLLAPSVATCVRGLCASASVSSRPFLRRSPYFSVMSFQKVNGNHEGQPCNQFFKNSAFSRAAPPVEHFTFLPPLSREPQKFAFPFLV